MTLETEITEYLRNVGTATTGAIKKNTSGNTVSNSVLFSVLQKLAGEGLVVKVGVVDWKYMGNGKPELNEKIEAMTHRIETKALPEGVTITEPEAGHTIVRIEEPVVVESKYIRAPNGVKILPINPSLYMVQSTIKYLSRNGEKEMLDACLVSGIGVVIRGPKGTGKSAMITDYAKENNIPLVTVDSHPQIDSGDLIGRFVIHEDETYFLLGALPKAIEIANMTGKCILAIEEINALAPESQKMLNPLLDYRKHVVVHDTDQIYRLKEGCQLLVIGTMNYGDGYGGIFELNEELKSRPNHKSQDYDSPEHELRILTNECKMDGEMAEGLIRIANAIRQETNVTYKLSTRELTKFGHTYNAYLKTHKHKEEALKNALTHSLVDVYVLSEERDNVKRKIKDVLDVEIELDNPESVHA